MEQFKVCEKETKTKAYSKEGLAQADRQDPIDTARSSSRDWIQEMLTTFNEQIDAFECDIESLSGSKKAKEQVHLLSSHVGACVHRRPPITKFRIAGQNLGSPHNSAQVARFQTGAGTDAISRVGCVVPMHRLELVHGTSVGHAILVRVGCCMGKPRSLVHRQHASLFSDRACF